MPQVLHAVEPGASWKRPAVHCSHTAWPATGVNVPGAHRAWAVEPGAHEEPVGQAVQSEALPSPTSFEYVPARQGSSADAPCGQKVPSPHILHAVAPEPSWKLPAVHGLHAACSTISVNVPGEHGALVVEPVLQLEPAGQAVQYPSLVRPALFE